MTQKLKINALPVAVAWLIIFFHGAIPHNHHQEHDSGCKSVYHCCHDSLTPHTENSFDDTGNSNQHFICHFNAGPFHSLDNDIVFYAVSDERTYPAEIKSRKIIHPNSIRFVSRLIFLPDNLRAPPTLMG
ncbi:MAG: hypothetical protein IH591_18775 [Bacteroidales bacterium]|nr:hypothetical protein [Bacteroidales bacterium]